MSLRHRSTAAYQAGILSAATGAEMADVEQMKKIVPFVTCEITSGQNACELVFGVNVPNLNFRINCGFLIHVSLCDSSLSLSS